MKLCLLVLCTLFLVLPFLQGCHPRTEATGTDNALTENTVEDELSEVMLARKKLKAGKAIL